MDISIVASGSNGNCCLVEQAGTKIMIDAGLSAREIESRLNRLGTSLEDLDALLITHSHSDHVRGAGIISRRYAVPVYMMKETTRQIGTRLGDFYPKQFSLGQDFLLNGISVRPISTSHSVASCGFVIGKFGIFTDTGIATPQMIKVLPKLECALIESNHNPEMVENGPYPPFLKKWILSDIGHLSNSDASSFIQANGENLCQVFLGHLSANNNTPEKAAEEYESIVKKKISYKICSRDGPTCRWEI
jgi:phosphoribosyl 1,2-cyclic phosphodiesterase